MSSSEISLLRKELAMVITENRNLQKKISEIEAVHQAGFAALIRYMAISTVVSAPHKRVLVWNAMFAILPPPEPPEPAVYGFEKIQCIQ